MQSSGQETVLKKKNPLKSFLAVFIYFAVFAGILLTALAVRYHFFLKELKHYEDWAKSPEPEDSEFPKLDSRELANLGFAQTADEHPVSSYINVPFEKKPGVIRIGAFGDSHTQGIEAALKHDYPSFLQRQFRKAGYDHVEVINFGVKSYGLYQAALMWEYLGKKYDLDYALFMVLSFHADRDLTFIEDTGTAVGVHARYILKNDQLEFVPVVGDSRQEASLHYFRMFPPLRYIRYDRRPPPLMRALLPEGIEWKFNPFYYRLGRSAAQEISKSYALLFDQIADEAKNVVVIARDEFIGEWAGKTSSPNVYVLRSQMASFSNWGPDLAPKSHQSAAGNDLQARELFALLTGREKPDIPVIHIRETPEPSPKESIPESVEPLHRYAKAIIELGGYPAGVFTMPKRSTHRIAKEVDLKKRKVSGLLFLSLSDMRFLPLDFLVKQDDPVIVSFRTGKKTVTLPVGKIDTAGGVISRVVFSSAEGESGFSGRTEEGEVKIDGDLSRAEFKTRRIPKKVRVLIGDREILDGDREMKDDEKVKDKTVRYYALESRKKYFFLRAKTHQYVPVHAVKPEKGALELVLTRKDGRTDRFPFFLHYEISVPDTKPFSPPYSGVIRPSEKKP